MESNEIADRLEITDLITRYYHHDLVRTAAGWRSRRIVDDMVWHRGF